MAFKYTEKKLNSLDKETVIQLFLSQQSSWKILTARCSWYWNSWRI